MLTEKDYCDWRTVKDLEYFGMNVYTKFKGIDVLKSVLLYEAQKWLREEKKIHIEIYACAGGYMWELCKAYETTTFSGGTTIYVCDDVANPKLNDAGRYDSYEEALLGGIKEAIKILKDGIGE